MLDSISPVLNPGFLDCGAHSVRTGHWKELPIADYVDWTCENHKRFRVIAGPDVIGDPVATKRQVIDFAKRTEGRVPREKILPTFHMRDRDIKVFFEMLEYAEEYGMTTIAVGGALGKGISPMDRRLVLETVFKHLDRKKFKIHLFGITAPDIVMDFAPDSVDSSSYLWAAKALTIRKYADNQRENIQHRISKYTTEQILDVMMDELWQNIHLLPEKYHDKVLLRQRFATAPLGITATVVNLLHVCEFERKVRARVLPHFSHYVTVNTGHLRFYSGWPLEMLQILWADKALVSYVQFHGNSSNRAQHDLNVFKLEA